MQTPTKSSFCVVHISKVHNEIIFTPLYLDHLEQWEYVETLVSIPFNSSSEMIGRVIKATLLTKKPQTLEGITGMKEYKWESSEIPYEKLRQDGRPELNIPGYMVSKAKTINQFSLQYAKCRVTATDDTMEMKCFPVSYYGLDDIRKKQFDRLYIGASMGMMCGNGDLGDMLLLLYKSCQEIIKSGLTPHKP